MDFLQPLAAIVLVMGLLGGALFLLKRRGIARISSGTPRRLELIERVALGPQHALHLVRAGDKLVLIATAPSSCQVLDGDLS
jgi:flagellar biogenesis protein FliO